MNIFSKTSKIISTFIIASCLYIYAYWGTLGFNVLPFIDIKQIILYALNPTITLAVYSVNITVFLFIAPVLLIIFVYFIAPQSYCKVFNKAIPYFIGLFCVLFNFATFRQYPLKEYGLIFVLPFDSVVLGYFILKALEKKKKLLCSFAGLVYFSVSILIMMSAFSAGKLYSWQIMENKFFLYTKTENKYYKYLGKVGDHYVLSSLDNKEFKICSTNGPLSLIRYQHDLYEDIVRDKILQQKLNVIWHNNFIKK